MRKFAKKILKKAEIDIDKLYSDANPLVETGRDKSQLAEDLLLLVVSLFSHA